MFAGCTHPVQPAETERTPIEIVGREPSNNGRQKFPQSFPDQTTAVRQGCDVVSLKEGAPPNCVLTRTIQNNLEIGVYDADANGVYTLSHTLILPSFYHSATVRYHMKPGVGCASYFIGVNYEGTRGTGVKQRMYALLGWDGDAFRVCLLESKFYGMYQGDNLEQELEQSYEFSPGLGLLTISTKLRGRYGLHWQGKITGEWQEVLFFDPDNFHFYDVDAEKRISEETNSQTRKSIADARLKFLRKPPKVNALHRVIFTPTFPVDTY